MVLAALRAQNLQTIAELADVTQLSKQGVRNALMLLRDDGAVHRRPEMRKFPTHESHIYAIGPGETDDHDEPLMPIRARELAIKESLATVDAIRSGYNPAMFDPFRVLRAQVGGMA